MIVERLEMEELSNTDEENIVYKDIVIVGNGPGGICLSYILNGNWPYYSGEPHPGDEMLTARLDFVIQSANNKDQESDKQVQKNTSTIDKEQKKQNNETSHQSEKNCKTKSLLKCSRKDLECLATGLEGRGTCRPLALLLDQLQHPCVDLGLDLPSLLTWKSSEHHPEHKIIDHVVLGKGPPGGAWQFMDPNVLTISLTRWMSLPALDLREWENCVETEKLQRSAILRNRIDDSCLYTSQQKIDTFETASRIPVGTVAAYYKNYVHRMGLAKYFKCGRTVTSVRPVFDSDDTEDNYGWIVKGYENQSGRRFRYKCKKVVLATGTTNSSNRLGISGEESQSSWITHDLNDLESRLDRLAGKCNKCLIREKRCDVHPVLIIGAGLSAADAIMAARFRGIPVIHAFRDSSISADSAENDNNENGVRMSTSAYERLQSLPVSMYPEYHKVYEMMADGRNHRFYKALPGYSLIDIEVRSTDGNKKKERKVSLQSPTGQIFTFRVSTVAVLIGSKPDLSYLGEYATKLGRIDDRPIDGRSNPIEIDDITYEVTKSPRKGLYAIGPLVGDNFVRFILGGAFGISANIISNLEKE